MELVNTLICICLMTTGYNADSHQTDNTPFITASGDVVTAEGIALSRDLLTEYSENGFFSFGDTVMVGYGCHGNELRIVNDTMHQRKRMQADLFYWSHEEAKAHGRRYLCLSQRSYHKHASADSTHDTHNCSNGQP